MVGDLEKSSFSNIEQQSLEFVKYTLNPWVCRWEQALQRALLSDDEKGKYFFRFNVEGLMRGDYQSRMNGYATARQNGWMSANDSETIFYEVRFLNYAGDDVLKAVSVEVGSDATSLAPTPETVEGMHFVSWNQDITHVTQDMTVRPIYEEDI